MTNLNYKPLLLSLLGTSSCFAGTAEDPVTSENHDWFTFSLEARARIEQRNQQGLDNSYAGTLRLRPGIQLGRDIGLAAFVQSEHTLAFIEDYQVGTPQSALFDPYVPGNTPIGDPENHELNQLYLQYKTEDYLIRAGRQRIIFDNAAFIGNVGWRQNEQSFDAAFASYSLDSLEFKYAYLNRVNRIFGLDGKGAVEALEGDAHLFNGSYKLGEHSLHGYVYLMDFSERQFARASSNTFGSFTDLKFKHGSYHAEFAYQTEAGSQEDFTALYGHLNFKKKISSLTITAGTEHLTEDFVTPLATVHAFNGFADVFINDRLGLTSGPSQWDGLTDLYLGVSTKAPGDIAVSTTAHAFYDDSLDQFYGWELDAVAAKKLCDSTKLVAKWAYFFGDDSADGNFSNDVSQFSIQLDYSF
ncbi:Alginate export [Rubritalea squalenifaciens DSM 18772]|uniref:Alginate export n=1 Tax=Rubritalea squalenifaciens DSM 18772 TaxID=1123071 RepID=A0A1M6NSZ5_9BACT|nr:alginate export family protein [Rubritalea squalenifaciens]SHJ98847.1 Alginate export [Rubritalea squalenifaciens DSM 18772]